MFKPTGARLLVEPVKVEKEITTESGIILQTEKKIDDVNHKDAREATVLAIGNGVTEVKVGDTVFYETHAAYSITVQGEDKTIVGLQSVIGIIPVGEEA